MNEPFEMTLYARLHTSYRREVWVGYGGKDTLFYMVLEEWWRKIWRSHFDIDLLIDFCNNFYFRAF